MCKVLAAIHGQDAHGLEALRCAQEQPVKVFVVHRTDRVAPTIREAARLGIEAVDLVQPHRVRPAADDEDVDETAVADDEGSMKIRTSFLQYVKKATKENPVWIILCHYTLRVMTLPNINFFKKQVPEKVGVALVIDEWHLLHRNGNVFTGLLAAQNTRTLLMTGTLPKLSLAGMQPKPTQDIFRQLTTGAPTVNAFHVRRRAARPPRPGARRGRPGHYSSGRAGDAAKEPLEAKAKATATWIVQNALRTVAVYTTSIDEADAFGGCSRTRSRPRCGRRASPTHWSGRRPLPSVLRGNRQILETFMRSTPTARLEAPQQDPKGSPCNATTASSCLSASSRKASTSPRCRRW